MPTTPAGACPFPFNFLFFLCFIERVRPGGRLDCRCLFQVLRALLSAAACLHSPPTPPKPHPYLGVGPTGIY